MPSLTMQSISLLQCPSYCCSGAKSRSLSYKTRFLHLGCPQRFTYANSFRGRNDRQVVKCSAWRAKKQSDNSTAGPVDKGKEAGIKVYGRDGEESVEEVVGLTWIQEKADDLIQYTGTVIHALPGPRVRKTSLPWLLAGPLAYLGLTFFIVVVEKILRFDTPREKLRRQVNKTTKLCKTLDKLLESKPDELNYAALQQLRRKSGFGMEEILRKYIHYALNEKLFNPDLVARLIHLRKSSGLEDYEVAEVLNQVSLHIVKEKGRVVMDLEGFIEKGIRRNVQALFSKILYLSKLDEFCSTAQSELFVKQIFEVTAKDADTLMIKTLSEASDVDSHEKMVEMFSDSDSTSGETDK